ncbi:hypothetical protein [Uliginosibacterium sediminicola]|uniref:Uncharacterized protein n=1 Tax=Uliginosibacterium sediminicola TaxID=2024550 RepID=A0ABU9YVV4_9RHOO
MKSTPITPGKLYRVTGCGIDMAIEATHPVDALLVGLDVLEILGVLQ